MRHKYWLPLYWDHSNTSSKLLIGIQVNMLSSPGPVGVEVGVNISVDVGMGLGLQVIPPGLGVH